MAEAPPAEGEVVKKPPPLVKRRDSEIERDRQGSFSRGEVEETIKRIASHRGIVGTLLTDKHCVPLRTSMNKFDTRQCAAFITPLAQRANMICLNHDPKNPLIMLRIRTTSSEIIVTPDDEFFLIALQKTSHVEVG